MKIENSIIPCLFGRKITITSLGYASIKYRGKQIYVHHIVVGFPINGLMVDHINGDRADNRRENLRIVDRRENGNNRKNHRKGRLVGATKLKNGKWKSQIRFNGKRIYIGEFSTEIEANEAYKKYLQNNK